MLVDRDHGVGVHHRGLHLFEVTIIMTFFSAALLGIRLQQRWGWGRPYGYDDLAATFAAVGSMCPRRPNGASLRAMLLASKGKPKSADHAT